MTTNVLIVKCSPANDVEMEKYSKNLMLAKSSKNQFVEVASYQQLKDLCKDPTSEMTYEEICFTGHGSYHHVQNVALKAKTIGERLIGSYLLTQVADTTVLAFQKLKTIAFEFFSCESAVSKSTYGRDDNGEYELAESFHENDADCIEALLQVGQDAEVSNIAYVAYRIARKMQDSYDTREVRVTGMNGVGYMNPKEMNMRCFDIVHFKMFSEIRKKLENVKDIPKNRAHREALVVEEQNLIHKYLVGRPSAHKIHQLVCLDMGSEMDKEEKVIVDV